MITVSSVNNKREIQVSTQVRSHCGDQLSQQYFAEFKERPARAKEGDSKVNHYPDDWSSRIETQLELSIVAVAEIAEKNRKKAEAKALLPKVDKTISDKPEVQIQKPVVAEKPPSASKPKYIKVEPKKPQVTKHISEQLHPNPVAPKPMTEKERREWAEKEMLRKYR